MEPYKFKKTEIITEVEINSVDEDKYVNEESKTTDSDGEIYQLVRDRKMGETRPPKRYAVVDLVAYALTVAHEVDSNEPRTYNKVITNKNKLQ